MTQALMMLSAILSSLDTPRMQLILLPAAKNALKLHGLTQIRLPILVVLEILNLTRFARN